MASQTKAPKEDNRFPGGLLRVNTKGIAERVDGSKPTRPEAFCGPLMKGFAQRHPCIGARSVSANGNLFFAVYEKMEGVLSAWQALKDLQAYYQLSDQIDDVAKTFAMVFIGTPVTDPEDFARKYWAFTQLMHDIDMLTNVYDPTVSPDASAPNFELSLGGRAVFTTTLNPAHPRMARRSNYPIWVCNQKRQFDQLRSEGTFQRWHESISQHDAQMDPSGTPNPLLADHGYNSAADQLPGWSLKPVPFQTRIGHDQLRSAFKALAARAKAEGVPADIVAEVEHLAAVKLAAEGQ